jgi:hypothetical protein
LVFSNLSNHVDFYNDGSKQMTPQYKAARDEAAEAACFANPTAKRGFKSGFDIGYAYAQAQEGVRTCIECGAQTCGDKPMTALLTAVREREEWNQQAEKLRGALEPFSGRDGFEKVNKALAEYKSWKENK